MDETEEIRHEMQAQINAKEAGREEMEKEHGQVWNTDELRRDFEVIGFMAPCCVVKRKSDGKKGSLYFQHSPRFYYGWEEDK